MKKYILMFLLSIVGLQMELYSAIEVRSMRLTTFNGLANNSVRCIYQDSKGFIWMGTQNGLSRYDGNSFITFRPQKDTLLSLVDHRVKNLVEDKNGFLWITTHAKNISCYDLRKNCFVDFTGCGEYMNQYDFISLQDNQDVWLWGDSGCRKISYKDGSFSSVAFNQSNGLDSNVIVSLKQGAEGWVWMATRKGLYYWDHTSLHDTDIKKAFLEIHSYQGRTFALSSDGCFFMYETSKGIKQIAGLPNNSDLKLTGVLALNNQWIVFTNKGGYSFDFQTLRLGKADAVYNVPNATVIQDNKQNYWLKNNTGKLYYIHAQTGAMKEFQVMAKEKIGLIDEERYYIYHDSRDILWIATYGNGLYTYDLKTGQTFHFTANADNTVTPIGSNFLQSVYEDRSGNIWVSAEFTGASCLQIINKGALRIFPMGDTDIDRTNAVRMLSLTKDGNAIVGTRGGELLTYNKDFSIQSSKKFFGNNIYDVAEDASGTKWYAFRGNGLLVGDRYYTHDDADTSSISIDQIFCILRDRKDRMWVGTFGGGLNLAIKGKDGYTFRHFFNSTYGQRRIRVLCEDVNGWIWLGTNDGVFVFEPEELLKNPEAYYHYTFDKGNLYSNEIKSIMQDSKGRIWVAESGAGFAMCNLRGDYGELEFTHYDTSDGLVDNVVQAFEEDFDGMIWITTEYGISCFNPEAGTFENYFFSSNMLGNVYSEDCAIRLQDGRLVFGTNFGFTVIDPRFIEKASPMYPITFTDLKLNGISVNPDNPDSPIKSSVAYISEINLQHFQNSFVLEFSTFDYMGSDLSKFKYWLENYDKDWSSPSSLNFAAYKNLPPGTYYLHVKACNASGLWSDQASVMKIVVFPPFWKTGWAYLIYFLLIAIILYIIYRTVHNISALRNKIKLEKQLTEYKLAFFTNISHEFRTPLTLIQGALEHICYGGKVPKEMNYSIKVMEKSTKRLLRLINQLLEFRKMQNNKLRLSLEETDVIAFLYEIFLSFKDVAESKNMDFRFLPSTPAYKMFIDKGNIDKVTYNILSNAFKYTPSGGKIELVVTVDEVAHTLQIKVSDTGVGVPKEKRKELFKRFMQSSFSGDSIGIGLHLTHELVSVHKGTVSYEENPQGGSIFIVTLPTDISVFGKEDFLIVNNVLLEEEAKAEKRLAEVVIDHDKSGDDDEVSITVPLNKSKVLIIEDDNDVREFLKKELSTYFEVVTESDGESGLERARTYDADLIISDVLMPRYSGFELTKRLKDDFSTSHIPIILLTALSSSDNHLKGVECGADAYITKPFSTRLLLVRVIKLLEQREKLREKFSNDPQATRLTICTSDKDKLFVEKMERVMQSQIANADFSIDEFASIMGLGRSIFYRKVRGLTGYSPNEYMRTVRMRKATELLREGNHNISEISYQVGINDPFYFSKCFKKQFGVTPTAFLKGGSEKSETVDDNKEEKIIGD